MGTIAGMDIRQARLEDVKAINHLELEVHAVHVRGAPAVFRMPAVASRRRPFWARGLNGRNQAILVAEQEGRLAGFVQVGLRSAARLSILRRRRFGYVSSLGVARQWRRRGVGKLLMMAAHRWLLRRHVKQIELNVWAFNRGALRFYHRLGYHFLNHRMGRTLG